MGKKPEILTAWTSVSCPLYACAFDDADPTCLVIGGGGGSGKNGIPNQVFLVDTTDAAKLAVPSTLTLSKSEDNVTALTVGPRSKDGKSMTVFAGVNASPEDLRKGNNPNFRTLGVQLVSGGAKAGGSSGERIAELARDVLCGQRGQDLSEAPYLRLCALSHPFDNTPQLGAAAEGFTTKPQIALFNVPPPSAQTGGARWTSKGTVHVLREPMDLDVVQTGPDAYQLAYCDDHEIFIVEVSKDGISEPKCVHTLEAEEGDKNKPTFRSLRYVTSGFLVTTINKPKSQGGGAVLHGYRLPKEGQDLARLVIRETLPRTVTAATGLAVRNLTPTTSPSEKQGDTQYVVAVAGNDRSINLFTLEHKLVHSVDLLANLAPFKHLKNVHEVGITGLSFSTVSSPKEDSEEQHESFVKLASVSMGNTAVVHSIPLKPYTDKSTSSGTQEKRPSTPRYVVALKSRSESPARVLTLMWLVIAIMCIIGQSVLELRGLSPNYIGITNYVTPWYRSGPVLGEKTIGDLLSKVKLENDQTPVIRHADSDVVDEHGHPPLDVVAHDVRVHGPAMTWDDLPTQQQDYWKARLKKAGHWVEDTGEAVFKGVLFGEIGGALGNMINEAM